MADEKTIKISATVSDPREALLNAAKTNNLPVGSNDVEKILGKAMESFARISSQTLENMSKRQEKFMRHFDSKNYNRAKRRKHEGSADPGDSPDDSPDDTPKTKTDKILAGFQKVIYAMNGANGRFTKGMAVLTRALSIAEQGFDRLNKNVKKTNESMESGGDGREGSDSPRKSLTDKFKDKFESFAEKLGVVGKFLVGVGKTIAKVIAAFAALRVAVELTDRGIQKLEEVVGGLSGVLNAAKARNKALEIQERLRSANRIGNDLADLEKTRGELERSAIRFDTAVAKALAPLLKKTAQFEKAFLDLGTSALEWLQGNSEQLIELNGNMVTLNENTFRTAVNTGQLKTAARDAEEYKRLLEAKEMIKNLRAQNLQIENLFNPGQFFGNRDLTPVQAFL